MCLCVHLPLWQVHFEDNPRDLQVLRHDKVLQPGRVQPHLKHIPSYLGESGVNYVTTFACVVYEHLGESGVNYVTTFACVVYELHY